MIKKQTFVVTFVALLLVSAAMALKVDHAEAAHMKKDDAKQPVTNVENSTNAASCTKEFCMSKYGLVRDPFNPACEINATCWR